MESTLRRHLQTCAAEFAKATEREISTVSRLAAGDWRFFDRLNDGVSFTARKYDLTMSWFSANWPEQLPWPADVPRPVAAANDPSTQSEAA